MLEFELRKNSNDLTWPYVTFYTHLSTSEILVPDVKGVKKRWRVVLESSPPDFHVFITDLARNTFTFCSLFFQSGATPFIVVKVYSRKKSIFEKNYGKFQILEVSIFLGIHSSNMTSNKWLQINGHSVFYIMRIFLDD